MSFPYYEKYPSSTVIFRTTLSILIFIIGAIILTGFGQMVGIGYLAFSAIMMIWFMRFRCKYCYYYGKVCTTGFGNLVPMFFKRGDDRKFPQYMEHAYPVLLVWVLPTFGGIVLLVSNRTLETLGLLVLFVILSFVFSERTLKKYGCDYCKQKANCPTYQFKHGRKN